MPTISNKSNYETPRQTVNVSGRRKKRSTRRTKTSTRAPSPVQTQVATGYSKNHKSAFRRKAQSGLKGAAGAAAAIIGTVVIFIIAFNILSGDPAEQAELAEQAMEDINLEDVRNGNTSTNTGILRTTGDGDSD